MQAPPTLEEIEKLHGKAPKPGRQLTKAESEEAKAAKKVKRPRYHTKCENWVRDRFNSLMRDGNISKNQQGPQYAARKKVDFSGTATILVDGQVRSVHCELEVKSFQGSFPLSNVTDKQREMLESARLKGNLALLVLVEHDKGKILQGWFIPFRATLDTKKGYVVMDARAYDWAELEQVLYMRSTTEPGFQGKSFRHSDLEHPCMYNLLCEKVAGRWRLPVWLERMKPPPDATQSTLF